MKTLIVYYSLTGNVKTIAESMASAAGADLLELKLKEGLKPTGGFKFLWGGKQVFMKEQPELQPIDKNPNDYDLIIIGTPVWAWTFAPALRTFFNKVKIENKKIALFCCHGGVKGKVFERMKKALGNNHFIGEIDFFEPLKMGTEKKKQLAADWVRRLI